MAQHITVNIDKPEDFFWITAFQALQTFVDRKSDFMDALFAIGGDGTRTFVYCCQAKTGDWMPVAGAARPIPASYSIL